MTGLHGCLTAVSQHAVQLLVVPVAGSSRIRLRPVPGADQHAR